MNNIYVDGELPKKCKDCPFSYVGYAYDFDEVRFCKLHKDHCMHWIALYNNKFNDCPLKPLKKALAEERKKVVQEVKQKLCIIEDTLINLGNGKEDALSYFVDVLDQIKRGK